MNTQNIKNEEVNAISAEAAAFNAQVSMPREPKKHKFADGEFAVPGKYKCTVTGKICHVTRAVLIRRIERDFDNKFLNWRANAVCADVKRIEKAKAKMAAMQAKIDSMQLNSEKVIKQ